MSYLDRQTKDIELPSGAKIRIRKFNGFDVADSGGLVMPSLVDGNASGDADAKATKQAVALAKKAILDCTGPMRFEDEELTIVDVPFCEQKPGEISLELVEQEDAQFIVDAVMEFSGFTGKEAAAAKTFREEPQAGLNGGPDKRSIRDESAGVPADVTA